MTVKNKDRRKPITVSKRKIATQHSGTGNHQPNRHWIFRLEISAHVKIFGTVGENVRNNEVLLKILTLILFSQYFVGILMITYPCLSLLYPSQVDEKKNDFPGHLIVQL